MDTAGLDALYTQYHRELGLYLFSLCRTKAAAEDLLQETFLKAFLSLPPGHPNVRAWLYRVAHNLWVDHQRKNARLMQTEPEQESGPGPEELLFSKETKKALYRALSQMEERSREVLVLQYFSGLSQKEIAGVLGIRADHARVLASRARRELKQRMEEEGYDLP